LGSALLPRFTDAGNLGRISSITSIPCEQDPVDAFRSKRASFILLDGFLFAKLFLWPCFIKEKAWPSDCPGGSAVMAFSFASFLFFLKRKEVRFTLLI
jgi:hypothetical protein